MGLFEKMEAALQAGDLDTVAEFYHADFEMKMHSNGTVMTKEQWKAGAASIFSNSNINRESARCIYENEDILVATKDEDELQAAFSPHSLHPYGQELHSYRSGHKS